MHYVFLVTGLFSSVPVFSWFFKAWARRLKSRLDNLDNVKVVIVSSDGASEYREWNKIFPKIRSGEVKSISLVGHSNGFRDVLRLAATVRPYPIAYVAGIDMTLADGTAKAGDNIKVFHEFHAKLNKANKSPKFKGVYKYWKINKGHTAAASDPFVQGTIYDEIERITQ